MVLTYNRYYSAAFLCECLLSVLFKFFLFFFQPNHAEELDPEKLEEQAAVLEKDLILKERETLDVLKELESTKRLVENLKSKVQKEESEANLNFQTSVCENISSVKEAVRRELKDRDEAITVKIPVTTSSKTK